MPSVEVAAESGCYTLNLFERCTPADRLASISIRMRLALFAAEMYRANLGDTRRNVEESLHAGIYVGLNVSFFYDPPASRPPMCCVFVGDDEWANECARMQSVNGLHMEAFEQNKPLPPDRFFPLAAQDETE